MGHFAFANNTNRFMGCVFFKLTLLEVLQPMNWASGVCANDAQAQGVRS